MAANPLEPRALDVQHLDAAAAVDLLRDILWSEATRCGLNRVLINVPGAITVSDGGIDGVFINSLAEPNDCVIPSGYVAFQVKKGDFSLTAPSHIQEILCKPRRTGEAPEINNRVRACFENDGTLVVVVPGWDNPENSDQQLLNLFRAEITKIDPEFSNAKFEFWTTSHLRNLIRTFPAICLRLRGAKFQPFITFNAWSSQMDMAPEWMPGPEQEEFVAQIRDAIRSQTKEDIRIVAEPGQGKTKAVLECLRPADLQPLVLYASSPQNVLESDLIEHIRNSGDQARAIVVIDECDFGDKTNIVNNLGGLAPYLTLITIYNERSAAEASRPVYAPQPLGDAEVERILVSYGLPQGAALHWISWCDGSPRVAHVLGKNLKNNPDDIFMTPSNVDVWERFIAGKDDRNSDAAKERRRVLLWLSLFKKFGFEAPYDSERRALIFKISSAIGTNQATFDEAIKGLRDRKILQGTKTLYITPKLFHIWLWDQWWETYGHGFDFDEFVKNRLPDGTEQPLPGELVKWHMDMYNYAESAKAGVVVESLLSERGPFSFETLDTRQGSDFFLRLTEANPRLGLECLERAIGSMSHEDLLKFRTGRHNCIVALQMICAWKETFVRGARILLKLALAETDTYSNNATGVFSDLFSLGPGAVAPTEAAPNLRFAFLRSLIFDHSPEVRALAYTCLSQALFYGQFVRMAGIEQQGTRKAPNLWKPSSNADWLNAYLGALTLLREGVESSKGEELIALGKITLKRLFALSRSEEMSMLLIQTIRVLIDKGGVDKAEVIGSVEQLLHYWEDDAETVARQTWQSFKGELVGDSFQDRLLRFAGLQIISDRFNRKNQHEDQTLKPLELLAQEAVTNSDLLIPELSWLTTQRAQNGHLFGSKLAESDSGFCLLPLLIEAQLESGPNSTYFLAGYLKEVQKK